MIARVRSVFGALNRMPDLGLFKAFHYAQGPSVEFDIIPPKRKDFASPHSGREGKQDRPVNVHVSDQLQEMRRLLYR